MTNSEEDFGPITDTHYELFGHIVYACACMEVGLKHAIAGMLDGKLSDVFILTKSANGLGLRNAAKSLADLYLSEPVKDQLIEIIADFETQSRLRNSIAHNWWTRGTRPGSIRPVRMDIRKGRAIPKGYEPDEPDYLLDDFVKCANGLFELNDRLIQFRRDTGMQNALMNV